jgi:hypothetical protein
LIMDTLVLHHKEENTAIILMKPFTNISLGIGIT